MRSYASISPLFWTRGSGKRLRGDPSAQLVALYLMSAPATSMVGIFHLALPTLCHETGLPLQEAIKGLQRCADEQIAFWDEAEELVFVPALAKHQIGEKLKKKDHKVKGVERALAPFKGHKFHDLFLDRYADSYCLTEQEEEAPSESLPRDDVPVLSCPESGSASPAPDKPKPADPMADQLRGKAPYQRPDVQRLHAAFKKTFGLNGHVLRGYGDENAQWLAAAIDAHGEQTCHRVLVHAPKDGMVSGRDDEGRVKHESIRYIFGNADTFARILRAADQESPGERESTVSKIARMKQQEPGAA